MHTNLICKILDARKRKAFTFPKTRIVCQANARVMLSILILIIRDSELWMSISSCTGLPSIRLIKLIMHLRRVQKSERGVPKAKGVCVCTHVCTCTYLYSIVHVQYPLSLANAISSANANANANSNLYNSKRKRSTPQLCFISTENKFSNPIGQTKNLLGLLLDSD